MITVHVEAPGDPPNLIQLEGSDVAWLEKITAASRKGKACVLPAGTGERLLSLGLPLERRGTGWRVTSGAQILRVSEGCVVPCKPRD